MTGRRQRWRCLALLAATAVASVEPTPGAASAPSPTFTRPIQLNAPDIGGYEPGMVIDRFGTIYVTAHKASHVLVVAPDASGSTPLRTASWLWMSSDATHWTTPSGPMAVAANQFEFGDEGDLALDDADHLYFVDTSLVDTSFTRWKIAGRGRLTLETTRPVLPTAGNADDRPWLGAHGDGHLLYLSNSGVSTPNSPASPCRADGCGTGRFTAYRSTNGSLFDPVGATLKDGGWCGEPAADHRPGRHRFAVACIDFDISATTPYSLWLFLSDDDGLTWQRRLITKDVQLGTPVWPALAIGPDGTIHVLYTDPHKVNFSVTATRLRLFSSGGDAKKWHETSVPTPSDHVSYGALAVGREGRRAVAFYGPSTRSGDIYLWMALSRNGGPFRLSKVSPQPIAEGGGKVWGDFLQVAFDPKNRANVVWTQDDAISPNVFFAREN